MKTLTKRSISLVLTFVLCLSMLFGINMPAYAANVDYVYSGNYIKNWGVRGTDATFLSPKAEEFYEDNNTSYAELASMQGSSTRNNVPSSELYNELQDLMKSNHSYKTSYNATRDLFQYTDCQNSGRTSNKISSFYSGTSIGPAWDGGSTWNREHTWPDSKGLEGSDEDDIMMLRPTSVSENSSRGNTAYGKGTDYYDPNDVSNGRYNLHGDVARIMLYQYVRWGNTSYMWGTSGVMESVEVLLEWMEEDPVDTWELGRNDSVESITGTRNVFVDYPELAFVLFSEDIPADYTTPSGSAANSEYTITAQSNNTAWGTVSVSGRTINAVAATGYEASSYTVVSGNAQVTRSGNAFIVNATSDVTVRINFVPRTQKNVIFAQKGGVASTQTVYGGDEITLPAHKGSVETGYTFVGWVDRPLQNTTSTPSFYTVGSRYTVTSDVTLYALYSKTENDGGSTSNVFGLYNGALTEGDYVIVYENGAMKAEDTGKTRLQIQDVTLTNGDIIAPDAKCIWHIAKNGQYWTMYNESAGKYAAGSGTKNQATLISSVTDYAKWTASGSQTYEFVNLGNNSNGVNPLLRRNGSVGFACYATNTNVGGALSLYKRVSGTIYYFTDYETNSEQEFYGSWGTGEITQSGIYTLTPTSNYKGNISADKITVFDKQGNQVKYYEKLGGYPLVAGQNYTIKFTYNYENDATGTFTWLRKKLADTIFPDTSASGWYNDAVVYSVGRGIIGGYGNGKFGTADSIQRQDFLVILARLDGVDLTSYGNQKSSFADVPEGSYYEAAVNWGAKNGIVTGYNNGKFGTGDKITREQLVTFLYRYANYKNINTGYTTTQKNNVKNNYSDYKKVSAFAQDAVIWAVTKDVISGKNGNKIAPQDNAQRSEVAKIMYNIFLKEIF